MLGFRAVVCVVWARVSVRSEGAAGREGAICSREVWCFVGALVLGVTIFLAAAARVPLERVELRFWVN